MIKSQNVFNFLLSDSMGFHLRSVNFQENALRSESSCIEETQGDFSRGQNIFESLVDCLFW